MSQVQPDGSRLYVLVIKPAGLMPYSMKYSFYLEAHGYWTRRTDHTLPQTQTTGGYYGSGAQSIKCGLITIIPLSLFLTVHKQM